MLTRSEARLTRAAKRASVSPQLGRTGFDAGLQPPAQADVLAQARHQPDPEQGDEPEAEEGEHRVELAARRLDHRHDQGGRTGDVGDVHGLAHSPHGDLLRPRPTGPGCPESDQREACEPADVEQVARLPGAQLGEPGERRVGDGDGQESGADRPQRPSGAAHGQSGEDDDHGRDRHHVAERVGQGDPAHEERPGPRSVEGAEHHHPAHEQHRAGDEDAVEDGAQGRASGVAGRRGERGHAQCGQGSGGEEADVGEGGERCLAAQHHVVPGPHDLARRPDQAGRGEEHPGSPGDAGALPSGAQPAGDGGSSCSEQLAELVDGDGHTVTADPDGHPDRVDGQGHHGADQQRTRAGCLGTTRQSSHCSIFGTAPMGGPEPEHSSSADAFASARGVHRSGPAHDHG